MQCYNNVSESFSFKARVPERNSTFPLVSRVKLHMPLGLRVQLHILLKQYCFQLVLKRNPVQSLLRRRHTLLTDDFIIFVRPDKQSTLNWVTSTTLQIAASSLVTMIKQLNIRQSAIPKTFANNLKALNSNLYLSVKFHILLSAPVKLYVHFLTDTLTGYLKLCIIFHYKYTHSKTHYIFKKIQLFIPCTEKAVYFLRSFQLLLHYTIYLM